MQPNIEDPCCACQEAKYELTFEGLWSRHTHPKDYPSNRWLTRFSDIIGASHTADYRFWEYGQQSSEGLQQVAEHGSTRMLESELKSQSDHIRTIIKARGISYPNVTGKTFAVFRVDSKHHLVSMVSMVDPSPDWIVGVSGLELCLSNCSWIDQKTLNLYPWDAGTDSGPSYTSPDQPTNPKDVVRRIKSNFPNDPRSPFYDSNGAEMKPMARIYFTRQRLYDKNCDTQSGEDERSMNSRACETGSWSQWSACSVQCGKGERHRQRSYLSPIVANQNRCTRRLTQREPCFGSDKYCHEAPQEENANEVYPECALTEWSPWSECSKECGRGVRTRSRQYVHRTAMKKCQRATGNPPLLEQTEECFGRSCGGDITEQTPPSSSNNNNDNFNDLEFEHNNQSPRGCRLAAWSNWSPCSTGCGMGRRMRYRYPLRRDFDIMDIQRRATDIFNRVEKRNNVFEDEEEFLDEEEEEVVVEDTEGVDNRLFGRNCQQLFCFEPNDPCYNQNVYETVVCGESQPNCDDIPPFCLTEPVVGHCRNPSNRWYYDNDKNDCALFSFSGCGGNQNNFLSRDECISTCKPIQTTDTSFDEMTIRDQKRQESRRGGGKDRRDCVMTSWERGMCNATCGEGYRVKTRRIVSQPLNGGRACPRRLTKYEPCRVSCDGRHDINPTWGPAGTHNDHSRQRQQTNMECRYSNWSTWSPCSRTCGEYSVQQRTRYVLNSVNAPFCSDRLEERRCHVMPCMMGQK